ncbi:MAG: (2Fe-2S)-binding protein [Conexivisphaerales archaeon]
MKVNMRLNGRQIEAEAEDNELLLDFIRDRLGVKSVKAACWRGECGTCMAIVNGKAMKTCLMLAVEADGADIITAEGLGGQGGLSPLQRIFVKHGAMQCGFCTPAFVVNVHYLLTENPEASDEEIKEKLSGMICRCGTYNQMLPAIREAKRLYLKRKK